MFHQGDLHSGISRAITESKSVACFVRGSSIFTPRLWLALWSFMGKKAHHQGLMQTTARRAMSGSASGCGMRKYAPSSRSHTVPRYMDAALELLANPLLRGD